MRAFRQTEPHQVMGTDVVIKEGASRQHGWHWGAQEHELVIRVPTQSLPGDPEGLAPQSGEPGLITLQEVRHAPIPSQPWAHCSHDPISQMGRLRSREANGWPEPTQHSSGASSQDLPALGRSGGGEPCSPAEREGLGGGPEPPRLVANRDCPPFSHQTLPDPSITTLSSSAKELARAVVSP